MKPLANRTPRFSPAAKPPISTGRSIGASHRKYDRSSTATKSDLNPDSKRLLNSLTDDAKQRGLVIFIGSGVNATAAHQWKKFLADLLKSALARAALQDQDVAQRKENLTAWCMNNLDICAQATLVKKILGSARYLLELQHALYSKHQNLTSRLKTYCQQEHPARIDADFEYLRSVALLCRKPQVKAVLTFNFDTLLETAIGAVPEGRQVRHYSGTSHSASDITLATSDLPMFYVHGRLPPPGGLLRDPLESVVFAYDEYLDQQADPLSWETATPLHLLRHFCTLWLGTSLTDWDMLRLLDAAQQLRKETHSYCIQCLEAVTDTKVACSDSLASRAYGSGAMRLQATLLDSVGVHLISAGKRFSDVPRTIRTHLIDQLPNR